jgi:hypothetical protein
MSLYKISFCFEGMSTNFSDLGVGDESDPASGPTFVYRAEKQAVGPLDACGWCPVFN